MERGASSGTWCSDRAVVQLTARRGGDALEEIAGLVVKSGPV